MASRLQNAKIVMPVADHATWENWHHNLMLTITFLNIDARLDLTPSWQIFELYRLMMQREMFYYDALLCVVIPPEQRN